MKVIESQISLLSQHSFKKIEIFNSIVYLKKKISASLIHKTIIAFGNVFIYLGWNLNQQIRFWEDLHFLTVLQFRIKPVEKLWGNLSYTCNIIMIWELLTLHEICTPWNHVWNIQVVNHWTCPVLWHSVS